MKGFFPTNCYYQKKQRKHMKSNQKNKENFKILVKPDQDQESNKNIRTPETTIILHLKHLFKHHSGEAGSQAPGQGDGRVPEAAWGGGRAERRRQQ